MSRTALRRRQLQRFRTTRAASLQSMHPTTRTRPAPSWASLLRLSATVPSFAEEVAKQQRRRGENNQHLYRVPSPPAASLSTMLHSNIQPPSHHNASPLISLQFELRSRQIWTNGLSASRCRNQRRRRPSHCNRHLRPLPQHPPLEHLMPYLLHPNKSQSTLLPFDSRFAKTWKNWIGSFRRRRSRRRQPHQHDNRMQFLLPHSSLQLPPNCQRR